ncbi:MULTISPECIES: LysR family transcriptional regulator [Ensifer]|jgi:DNA-binding transcriptional LysR family regulator|uniref:LysR substrate-binding domain-containing protein n=1 Tax=Ensifer adhaerens TaxID=106592 RepID=A0ABY8HGE1_ENSAD|nr:MULTISPECIES: LysR family transcriptional regulator [Ensifer]OWZ94665.1 LysR family transcriptional regulator [Sinorhizobium sp. LM21]ANK74406.1 LysR family transcriptional regulator [Ensifer adhaerens]KDP70825.1 LysR family transcriptional regulator [Ensifer adhaerens]KQX04662.1 LysR family transcriptional regulator [Ensifer sp. Root423]KQX54031.1 LysR family transcriptional regulator [Ensifer sp. Root1298]
MMKIEGIAAFVAVAEAGSISEAARRLRLSKSVVSERVAELERGLNATLLHRTTRKLTLTEDGIAFRERAIRIVSEVQAAASDLAERRGLLTGPLRIAAPVSFGRRHLGPALYPFLAQHPEIELTLDLDDRRVDAASEGYDAIVRHGAIADSRLVVWKLARSRRLLVAAPDYLDRHGTPASLAELEGHRGIFYTNRGAADWRFEGPGGATVVRARLALGMNNGDMLHDAAVAGLGIALLPAFIAGPAVREGQLNEIDVGLSPEPEFIYMAHPEGRRASTKLRAIAQHLKEAFGDPPYWDP